MPPSIYTSTTMYYAKLVDATTGTVVLVPESGYLDLPPEEQALYYSLEELGFPYKEQVVCASLIEWLRSVRRIHTSTVALYKDALEEEKAYGGGAWSLQCYKNAVAETNAALAAAFQECNCVFSAVATALLRC
jgi:hypothetical protein